LCVRYEFAKCQQTNKTLQMCTVKIESGLGYKSFQVRVQVKIQQNGLKSGLESGPDSSNTSLL